MAGACSFDGQTAGNINRAIVFNAGDDIPSEVCAHPDADKTITSHAGEITERPAGDLFSRFE
jgi:hypothetical protein